MIRARNSDLFTISASWDNTVKVWNVKRGTLRTTLTADAALLCCKVSAAALAFILRAGVAGPLPTKRSQH
jgi:hypothetical protein